MTIRGAAAPINVLSCVQEEGGEVQEAQEEEEGGEGAHTRPKPQG